LKKVLALILISLFFIGSSAFCITMDDPIRNAAMPRGLGMGMAFVAVADDSSSPIFNPAGLVSLKNPEMSWMNYSRTFNMFNYVVANGAYPTEYGTFGLGGVFSNMSNVTVTVPTTREASYADNLTLITYSSNLRRFVNLGSITRRIYIGMNLKLFQKNYSGSPAYTASGMNIDLGLKYTPNSRLSLGINKQNILGGTLDWNTGAKEYYPSPLVIGAAYRPDGKKQTYALDIEMPNDGALPALMHMGTEYEMDENLVLRGGFDQLIDADASTFWGLTLGLGLNVGGGFVMDYAYHPYYNNSEDVSNFISISYVGEEQKKVKGEIKAFQPSDDMINYD